MQLIVDIGNSFTKFALYKCDKLLKKYAANNLDLANDPEIFFSFLRAADSAPKAAIISSVGKKIPQFIKQYCQELPFFLIPKPDTPLPIQNHYVGKATLGLDRIAAATGANNIFRNTNVLVIDTGTALTIDFVSSANAFKGGIISPGLQMRFNALHRFTGKLPQLNPLSEASGMQGLTTEEAIRLGVQNGIVFEIQKYIETYQSEFPDIKTVLTGGDIFFFENTLKKRIFAQPNLVLNGLNRILQFNYDKTH